MSEEITETNFIGEITENTEEQKPSLEPGFKSVCARIGLMMIVVYTARFLCSLFITLTSGAGWYKGWGPTASTLLNSVLSIIFLNVIPITAGIFILKFPLKTKWGEMYAKPKYFARSLGIFPAGYGLAMVMQLFTLLLARLFANTPIEDSFNATKSLTSQSSLAGALIMFFHSVVLAPLFEEFWFRGLVLHSLKPYGNGFAIFVSSILFGLTHSNLAQFFYATVIGIVLGYVAVQTKSIVTTTLMHAMFNSISGVTTLFFAEPSVSEYIYNAGMGNQTEQTTAVTMFLIWSVAVLLFALVGVIMAIVKLAHIKRYRVPKVQTELSTGKRWGIFISRPTVVIMLLMAIDTMTFLLVTRLILRLFQI